MLISNFNSWDKGIFSVVGKIGGPVIDDVVNTKYYYRRDDPTQWLTRTDMNIGTYGPTEITYKFNKAGFRSDEFVDDGRDCILSIGDSFTMCLGVPYEHTWPYILSQKIGGCKNYNLGLASAGGDYIVRTVSKTIEVLKPKAIFILWPSFITREIAIKNRYITYIPTGGDFDGQIETRMPIFAEFTKLFNDNSYIIYHHRKNVEMLHALCNLYKVPCQEMSMNNFNEKLELVDIAEAELSRVFDIRNPNKKYNILGADQNFATARDGLHFGHDWNKYISDLFYSQYLKNSQN